MKRLFSIFAFLLCAGLVARASLVVSNGDVITFNGSSYDTSSFGEGAIMGSLFALKYPHLTNWFFSVSRGGEDWNSWYQNEEEKWALPLWASGTSQVRNIYYSDDNGGFVSNNIITYGNEIATAPQSFWNGTAATNEGYNFPIQWFWPGNPIHNSADGDSGAISRNAGDMVLAGIYGTPVIDQWHTEWNNGFSNDIIAQSFGTNVLGFANGSHFWQPGYLGITLVTAVGMGIDTNYGGPTFDWSDGSAVTNQCAVSGITKSGGVLSCSITFDTLPPGFAYQPTVATNNAALLFNICPNMANWLQWNIGGTNFVAGNTYKISINGTNVDVCTGAQLNAGRNWFTNTTGAIWSQRLNTYLAFLDLYGLDHVSYAQTHNAGSNGTLGVPDTINYQSQAAANYATLRGSAYVSAMAPYVADLKQYVTNAYSLAQPVTYSLAITEVITRYAPFHR